MITSIKATLEKNLRNIKYQNQRVLSLTFDYNIQFLIIVKIGEIRELKLIRKSFRHIFLRIDFRKNL